MIVHAMHPLEVVREMMPDTVSVLNKTTSVRNRLRKKSIKTKKEYYELVNYKSPRNNDWLIIVTSNKKECNIIPFLCTVNNGFEAFQLNLETLELLHISGHFLDRYNERYLKNENISKKDILVNYIMRNPTSSTDVHANNVDMFTHVNDGVVLGDYYEYTSETQKEFIVKLYQFKTFITKEMLFEKQYQKYTEMSKDADGTTLEKFL